jgi:hypothetical protein
LSAGQQNLPAVLATQVKLDGAADSARFDGFLHHTVLSHQALLSARLFELLNANQEILEQTVHERCHLVPQTTPDLTLTRDDVTGAFLTAGARRGLSRMILSTINLNV